jgi:hypothetical protein
VTTTRPVKDASRAGASRRSRRVRETLPFTEIALSFVLLAGASLFVLSFVRLMSVDPASRSRVS